MSRCCGAGGSWEVQAKQLAQPVDVLIGTPQRLLQHAEKGNLFYGCAWGFCCFPPPLSSCHPLELSKCGMLRVPIVGSVVYRQGDVPKPLSDVASAMMTMRPPCVSGRCGQWFWTRLTRCLTRASGQRCARCCGRYVPSRSPLPASSSQPP